MRWCISSGSPSPRCSSPVGSCPRRPASSPRTQRPCRLRPCRSTAAGADGWSTTWATCGCGWSRPTRRSRGPYRVSGHEQRVLPGTGTFWIYSTVRYNTVKDNPGVKLDYMMRFAVGDEGLSIGFHAIPRNGNGYIQSTDTLGEPASARLRATGPRGRSVSCGPGRRSAPRSWWSTQQQPSPKPRPGGIPGPRNPRRCRTRGREPCPAIDAGWPVPVSISDQALFSV